MGANLNVDFLAMLDAPWLKKQIETHLVFGFCSRQVPFALLFIFTCVLYIIYQLLTSKGTLVNQLWESIEFLFFIVVGLYLLKMPKYYQAAIGWWTIKASLFLICTTGIIDYGLVGFFKGSPDAIHVTLLALIWFPGVEFIPRLTERQKYITMARIAATIPLLILWHRTGTW